jgi:lysophospholipase L1-like esterase
VSAVVATYAALGDSFSAGLDDGSVPWPELTARGLEARGEPVELHNLASVGATTADVLEQQLEPALRLEPGIVSLVCGANDVLLTSRPDIEGCAANVDALLARIRAELPGATIVTATYPDPGRFAGLRPRTRKRVVEGMTAVNLAIRSAAESHDALIMEFSQHPGVGDRANVGPDGFHPSALGHRRAAAAVLEALAQDRAERKACA